MEPESAEEEGQEVEEATITTPTRAANSHEPLLLFLMSISCEVKRMFYLNESLTVSHIEGLLEGNLTANLLYDIAFWILCT